MTPEELRRAIHRVGERFDLGDYEFQAYLSVLRHGRMSASDIAAETDIPQPRVYDTVRSLRDLGLVELREGRPLEVVAIDPARVFEDVRGSIDALVAELESMYTAPVPVEEALSLVTSRSTILRHLQGTIEAAEYELTLAMTPDLLDRFEPAIAETRAAEVAVELLLAPASEAPGPEAYDYERVATAVRVRRGVTTPIVAIADGVRAVYTTPDALGDGSDRYGVLFNRSSLGFLVSGFFHAVLWTTAEPILDGGLSVHLPRRYASIRRCVKDLERSSGDVYAEVEGRDVTSGEPRTVAGPVVEVARDPTEQTAAFTVESDDGPVRIGGWMAALEDVEAHDILISRSPADET